MRVYLTDFGLAGGQATSPSPRFTRVTRTGAALGTPAYMSPELARGEIHALTPASDVWALGCVCYELLAGRRAFEGTGTAEVVAGVLAHDPPPLRITRPELPAPVCAVVARAMAKAAPARYREAGALRDDIERVLRGEAPARRPVRRRRALVAGLVIVGVAAGLVVVATRSRPGPSGGTGAEGTADAEGLAARGWALRQEDPRGAAALLDRALGLAPDRQAWRVQRGILRWAGGDGAGAVNDWLAVPDDAPEAAEAWWYRALEAYVRAIDGGRVDELPEVARLLDRARVRIGPAAEMALAMRYLLAHRDREAAALLANRLGWEAAMLRGILAHKRHEGDPAAQVREYTTVLREGLPLTWCLLERAGAREQLGDFDGAMDDLSEVLARNPESRRAWTNRAIARTQAGSQHAERGDGAAALAAWSGAIADADATIRLDPGGTAGWCNRAITHGVRGRWLLARGRAAEGDADLAAARADWDAALARDPQDSELWYGRGRLRRSVGELAGADGDCTEALRLAPGLDAARNERGLARHDLRDFDGALADFEAILAKLPDDPLARHNRGRIREARGDYVGAIADFTAALAGAPDSAPTYLGRGRARYQTGDLVGARDDCTAGLVRAPDDAEALCIRGLARAALGDDPGALADYDAALVSRPGFAEVHLNRGHLFMGRGDIEGAIAAYEAARHARANYPDGHGAAGTAYFRLGRFAEAATAFREYQRVAPATHAYRERVAVWLAECEARLGMGR